MDKNKIILKKLEKFLQNHSEFKEEYEVVYLFAEIRKIIEDDKTKYETLRFYCCWVLHSRLSYNSKARFLSGKFDKFINSAKSKKEIQRDLINGQKDFFKLNDLNLELNDFFKSLKNNKLPMDFLEGNKWYKFCKLFLENIMECQIDFGLNTKSCRISKFSVEKASQDYYYLFYLSNGVRIPKIGIKFKKVIKK